VPRRRLTTLLKFSKLSSVCRTISAVSGLEADI
jgi:hypothetical protein